jgi:hypothetical protein
LQIEPRIARQNADEISFAVSVVVVANQKASPGEKASTGENADENP